MIPNLGSQQKLNSLGWLLLKINKENNILQNIHIEHTVHNVHKTNHTDSHVEGRLGKRKIVYRYNLSISRYNLKDVTQRFLPSLK